MRWREKKGATTLLSLIAGVGCLTFPLSDLRADDRGYSVNNFGGIGLLDMRTARFFPDGMIAVGVHHNSQSTRFFSTWQATPWLETTLSYTDFKPDSLGPDSLGLDRSLDVKIRLWTEGNYRPQLAIGIQDAFGAGNFDAEYIVASKRYYDFDFTMGFAWGYLGSRGGVGNMFKVFGDGFDDRSATTSSGGLRTGSFFSGQDMSFFAGAEYHPPIKGLSFKAEYSGVDTTKISAFSHLKRKSAFNFGVNYKPLSWADVAVGFDQGDSFSIRLTLKQNLHKLKFQTRKLGPDPAPILVRTKSGVTERLLPKISSSLQANDTVFDYLRRLGATVTGIEQAPENIILRIKTEDHTGADHLTLLGAVLESYDRVTLYIVDGRTEVAQKYDATILGIVGKAALEKFRSSAVYLREKPRTSLTSASRDTTAKSTYDKMAQADLSPVSISLGKQRVAVRKETGPYFSEVKNMGRTARILTREMPDNVEEFLIISEKDGIEVSRVSLLRQDLEKASDYRSSPEEIWANTGVRSPGTPSGVAPGGDRYQPSSQIHFDWGIKPELLSHFGGNEDGRFRADLSANLFGSVQITRQVKFSAELKQYIVGDIDKIPLDGRPGIPKVRSDIARYAREGRTALDQLHLDYISQIDRNIYARLTGGLLESMFGGFGAEILYRPYAHNFAVGLDVNWVKQRDYNQIFSFRDYDVLTGHATVYHENTTYNISSKLSVGRYLAGDFGATFDVSRRFSNGVRIGVWATVTDMASDDFGAGSFDKGIYLTLPLEIFWYRPTQEKMRFNFRSLGKNGGQKLDRAASLYEMLSSGRRNRIAEDWQGLLE